VGIVTTIDLHAKDLLIKNDRLGTVTVRVTIANFGQTGERGGLFRMRPVLAVEGKQTHGQLYSYSTKVVGRTVVAEWSDVQPGAYVATRPGGIVQYFIVEADRTARESDPRECAQVAEEERDAFYDLTW
jgi:hypothetical protein